MHLKVLAFAPFLWISTLSSDLSARTIFVQEANPNSQAPYNTWENAASNLQDALIEATNGDQVWVAEGTYYPDEGGFQTEDSRSSTFLLRGGIEVYGGFTGSETLLASADPAANPTILSGEIQQDADSSNNAFHVILAVSSADAPTILQGFTIQDGNANILGAGFDSRGGGLYCSGASLTINECLFVNNSASTLGGGSYNKGSSPTFTNCSFKSNQATTGGAMANDDSSSPKLVNVEFLGNKASQNGGALFSQNSSAPNLINCSLAGNQAGQSGGAVYNANNAFPILENCIIWKNQASGRTDTQPASVFNDGTGAVTFFSCLVENYTAANLSDGTPNVNFDSTDPFFITTPDPSTAPTTVGNLRLGWNSPALDKGANRRPVDYPDLAGNNRILNQTIDLGAYEGPHFEIIALAYEAPADLDWDSLSVSFRLREGSLPAGWENAIQTSTTGNVQWYETSVSGAGPEYTITFNGILGDGSFSIAFNESTAGSIGFLLTGFTPIEGIQRLSSTSERHYVVSGNPQSAAPYDTWETAAANLQDALALAAPGDQIWVAKGTYYPDGGSAQTEDDREATFQLKNGVGIHGGFKGDETELSAADMVANLTRLSGDIGVPGDASDNSHHIVTADAVDSSARLQGFAIVGGRADGPSPYNQGGGLFCNSSSPTITNCSFSGSSATEFGGALSNQSSSPTLTNCLFQGNQTNSRGGAIYNFNSSPQLTNCSLEGNRANNEGGAIHNNSSTPSLVNCIIWNNAANGATNSSQASISNAGTSSSRFSYCLVANYSKTTLDAGTSPNTNFPQTANPRFIRETAPATAPTVFVGDLRLRVDSPLFDVGDNAANTTKSDLAGNARILKDVIDLGAYEGTPITINIWRRTGAIAADLSSLELEIELDYELDEIPQALLDAIGQSALGSAEYTSITTSGSGFTHTLRFNGLSGEGLLTIAVDPDLAKEKGINFIGETSTTVELRSSASKVHYVNAENTKSEAPYDTWATASNNLQDALYWAVSGDQIRVAKGIYYPDDGELAVDDAREETFVLKSGVGIYGGFTGDEQTLEEADPFANLTVLSGAITQGGGNNTNSYHVVTVRDSNGGIQPTLQGFDIRNGYANGLGTSKFDRGGAIYCFNSSPKFIGCSFIFNFADQGGAIYNESESSPEFTHCYFGVNSAQRGGAIYNAAGSSPQFENCSFQGNMADLAGGAIHNLGGPLPDQIVAPKFTNCAFSGNRADGFGGGAIYNDGANPLLVNCTIQGNRAGEFKGAIHNTGNSSPSLTNCIVWGNAANGMDVSAETSIYTEEGSTPSFRYCLVEFYQKAALDAGDIARNNLAPTDPRFVRPADANQAPTAAGELALSYGSPAIDKGSNPNPPVPDAKDLFYSPRILNGAIDLGAIEGAHIEVLSWDAPTRFPTDANELTVRLSLGGGPLPEAWKKAITTSVGGSVNYSQPEPTVSEPTPGAFLLKLTGLSGEGPISLSLDPEKAAAEGLIFLGDDSIQVILRSSTATPTHYVNAANTAGEAPYDTWEKAAANLQDVLAYAASGDEVWVAEGTYYPDLGEFQTDGDREASFQLENGIEIYGGFAGGETGISGADPFTRPTILSGDIDGDAFNDDGNSYHVVTAELTDETAQLHGFTITAGNAYDVENDRTASGGGLFCKDASPTLTYCIFQANKARDGGAIYSESSSPKLTNCSFRGNTGTSGGAIFNRGASPLFTNCSFQANKAFDWGGAVHNRNSAPEFTNCAFQGNNASLDGGAIYNRDASAPKFTNCIIWNNEEDEETITPGDSIDNNDTGFPAEDSIPVFSHCIVENYSKSELDAGDSPNTNFAPSDPLFVSPTDPLLAPFIIAAEPGAIQSLRLQYGSPAIDKGTTPNPLIDFDLAGNPRLINDKIDLGAYEGTVYEIDSWVLSDPLKRGDTSLELTLTLKNGGKLPDDWQNTLQAMTTGSAAFGSTQDFGSGPAYIIVMNGLSGDGRITIAFDETLAKAKGFAFENNSSFQAILRSFSGGSNLYVNAANTVSQAPYNTWETAANKLQDALDYALPGDDVWVAKGTYYPDEGENQTDGKRTTRFNLKSDIGIYGGFAGGETQLSEADPASNLTTLSGDIDQDGEGGPSNSYHVVLANATNANAILDGFIIVGGYSDDPFSDNAGGGLYCKEGATPTISNCWFEGNFAIYGGAIGNKASSPNLLNCTFKGNIAIYGGAIRNYRASAPTLTNCSIQGNRAIEDGGAIYNDSPIIDQGGASSFDPSAPVLINCALQGNRAAGYGGAVYSNRSTSDFINCSFQGNRADISGGAIASDQSSSHTLKNCIIWDNQYSGGTSTIDSSLDINLGNTTGTFTSQNSLVENFSKRELDDYSGGTNSNLAYSDPGFFRETSPTKAPTSSANLRLSFGSFAIDAGENDDNLESKDLAGNDRVLNSVIDLGAYEGGVDPERPIITLTGKAAITLPFNTTWIDPSAIVTDNVDSDLTVQIGGDTVDPLRFGDTFTIIYTVTDSDGNSAIQLTRTVTIAGPIPPAVITLSGSILTWSPGRVLQTSDDMVIWTDLPNAKSPLTISHSDPKRFWRLRDVD